MADLNTPLKGVAFDLGFTLYKSDGSVIANPGTLTKKISKDFGDYADIGTVTEEDTTYGQLKAALTTSEMNADVVMVYVKDDTSGCVPFTATIYPAAAAPASAAATAVWGAETKALTDKAGFTLTAAYDAAKTAASPSDVASALGTYDAPTKAELDSGLAALNDVSTAEVNAACDSAIADAALATAADLATVDGVADSIKAKTDNLPTDPADQSLIEAAIAGISIPAPTVDFTEVLAAIAAIGESGVEVDMSGVLDALAVLQASLGAANITVTAPVAASGTVTLYQGDDYDAAHGRGVAFAVADDVHALGLDAVGAVVSFKCAQATWTGTATETEAGYTLVFEPTAAQTGALTMRRQGYEVEAVLADGDVVTLATGTLAVERDVPSVG